MRRGYPTRKPPPPYKVNLLEKIAAGDAGTFWPARATGLAAHANDRLGPGFAGDPY